VFLLGIIATVCSDTFPSFCHTSESHVYMENNFARVQNNQEYKWFIQRIHFTLIIRILCCEVATGTVCHAPWINSSIKNPILSQPETPFCTNLSSEIQPPTHLLLFSHKLLVHQAKIIPALWAKFILRIFLLEQNPTREQFLIESQLEIYILLTRAWIENIYTYFSCNDATCSPIHLTYVTRENVFCTH
jgi:hypothetical protein